MLSVVWVVLLVAMLWMWGRSYWIGATGSISRISVISSAGPPGQVTKMQRSVGFFSGKGRFLFRYAETGSQSSNQVRARTSSLSFWMPTGSIWSPPQYYFDMPQSTLLERIGFGHRIQTSNLRPSGPSVTSAWGYSRKIGLPFWLPAIVLALGAWQSVRRSVMQYREEKAARDGRCLQCGYDLRHSPATCPECGLTTTASPPQLQTAPPPRSPAPPSSG